MDLTALTVEHWIFICLNFLMCAGLSYWRIRACVFANFGDKWLKWKIVIAVVLCIYTVVSTVLMLCYNTYRQCTIILTTARRGFATTEILVVPREKTPTGAAARGNP